MAESLVDRLQDTGKIAADVAIPEPENTKTGSRQCVVAILTANLMRIKIVLAAVDLDNKAMLEANEIHDKALARRLPAEMIAWLPP